MPATLKLLSGLRRLICITAAALMLLNTAVKADSLQVSDTVDIKQNITLWPDSALAVPDSSAEAAAYSDRWLIPLGVIVVSVSAAIALFFVRSR